MDSNPIKYDVFISYSSLDREIARKIVSYLEKEGLRCWIDYRDLPHGAPWAGVIPQAIKASGLMVSIVSENYNGSRQVDRELAQADDNSVPMLPFKISDTPLSDAKSYYFKNINWINGYPEPENCLTDLYSDIAAIKEENGGWTMVHREPASKNVTVTDGSDAGRRSYLGTEKYVVDHTVDYLYEDDYQDGVAALKNFEYAEAADLLLQPALNNYRDSQLKFRILTHRSVIGQISKRTWSTIIRHANEGHGWAEAMLSRYYDLIEYDHDQSFEYAARSAQQGDIFGEFELALMYDLGISVEMDQEKGFEAIRSLERRNFPPAMFIAARNYLCGWTVKTNIRRGLSILERGIALGDPYCMGEMGSQMVYGDNVPLDIEGGCEMIRRGLAEGVPSLFNLLANSYLFDYTNGTLNSNEGECRKALEIYNKGISKGVTECMQSLGFIYANAAEAVGLKPDPQLAFKWYRTAAEHGDMSACGNTGDAYYFGNGVEENNEMAWKWFETGETRGDAFSIYKLGRMCYEGYAPEGHTKADCIQYFRNAVFLGSYGGMESAKMLYAIYRSDDFERGFPAHPVSDARIEGVNRDDRLAIEALEHGARMCENTCRYLLGCALTDPSRPYSNEIEGIKMLEEALSSAPACYHAALRLCQLCREGIGMSRDEKKAQEYYNLAAAHLDQKDLDEFNGKKSEPEDKRETAGEESQPQTQQQNSDAEMARKAYNLGLEYARPSMGVDALPKAYYYFDAAVSLGYGPSAERQFTHIKKRIATVYPQLFNQEQPDWHLIAELFMNSALLHLPDQEVIGAAYREKLGLTLQKKWKELKETAAWLQLMKLPPIGRDLHFAAAAMAILWTHAVKKAATTTDLSVINPLDYISLADSLDNIHNTVWQNFVIIFTETKMELRDFARAVSLGNL